MPIDPFIVGSIGSSILGGLFGRKNQKDQTALQREFAQNSLRWNIQQARAEGLHPLVGAGQPGAQYQPSQASPMQGALAGISDVLLSQSGRKKQEQLVDAQIEEAQSRTILNKANAQRALLGPNAPNTDPFKMRSENALIRVKLENGDIILMPNPDVYEISPTELATARVLMEGSRMADLEAWNNQMKETYGGSGGGREGPPLPPGDPSDVSWWDKLNARRKANGW